MLSITFSHTISHKNILICSWKGWPVTATKACVVSVLGGLESSATTWEGQEGAAQDAFTRGLAIDRNAVNLGKNVLGMSCGISSSALGETCSSVKGYGYDQTREIMETKSSLCASTRANHTALDLVKGSRWGLKQSPLSLCSQASLHQGVLLLNQFTPCLQVPVVTPGFTGWIWLNVSLCCTSPFAMGFLQALTEDTIFWPKMMCLTRNLEWGCICFSGETWA